MSDPVRLRRTSSADRLTPRFRPSPRKRHSYTPFITGQTPLNAGRDTIFPSGKKKIRRSNLNTSGSKKAAQVVYSSLFTKSYTAPSKIKIQKSSAPKKLETRPRKRSHSNIIVRQSPPPAGKMPHLVSKAYSKLPTPTKKKSVKLTTDEAPHLSAGRSILSQLEIKPPTPTSLKLNAERYLAKLAREQCQTVRRNKPHRKAIEKLVSQFLDTWLESTSIFERISEARLYLNQRAFYDFLGEILQENTLKKFYKAIQALEVNKRDYIIQLMGGRLVWSVLGAWQNSSYNKLWKKMARRLLKEAHFCLSFQRKISLPAGFDSITPLSLLALDEVLGYLKNFGERCNLSFNGRRIDFNRATDPKTAIGRLAYLLHLIGKKTEYSYRRKLSLLSKDLLSPEEKNELKANLTLASKKAMKTLSDRSASSIQKSKKIIEFLDTRSEISNQISEFLLAYADAIWSFVDQCTDPESVSRDLYNRYIKYTSATQTTLKIPEFVLIQTLTINSFAFVINKLNSSVFPQMFQQTYNTPYMRERHDRVTEYNIVRRKGGEYITTQKRRFKLVIRTPVSQKAKENSYGTFSVQATFSPNIKNQTPISAKVRTSSLRFKKNTSNKDRKLIKNAVLKSQNAVRNSSLSSHY